MFSFPAPRQNHSLKLSCSRNPKLQTRPPPLNSVLKLSVETSPPRPHTRAAGTQVCLVSTAWRRHSSEGATHTDANMRKLRGDLITWLQRNLHVLHWYESLCSLHFVFYCVNFSLICVAKQRVNEILKKTVFKYHGDTVWLPSSVFTAMTRSVQTCHKMTINSTGLMSAVFAAPSSDTTNVILVCSARVLLFPAADDGERGEGDPTRYNDWVFINYTFKRFEGLTPTPHRGGLSAQTFSQTPAAQPPPPASAQAQS